MRRLRQWGHRPFNATNQWHCYRQFLKSFGEKKFKCKPVFIDNTIHELDFSSNDLFDCNLSLQKSFDKFIEENNLRAKCLQICPKDCRIVDIKIRIWENKMDFNFTIIEQNLYNFSNYLQKYPFKKTLVSDSTQPMFVYNEEPVMPFTEYLCYCGGLIGFRFGTSTNNIIFSLIKLRLWLKNVLYNRREGRVVRISLHS